MQTNLFYAEPDLIRLETRVARLQPSLDGHRIATVDNIVRSAGGGEPADRVAVSIEGIEYPIEKVEKMDGCTWLTIGHAPLLALDMALAVQVDGEHRLRRRRLHTAVHIGIRSALNLHPPLQVTEAEIDDDAFGATIHAKVAEEGTWVDYIIPSFHAVVSQARPVDAVQAKSIEAARAQFGSLFRVSERHQLSGRVRLVRLDGYDVNPCAGLHAPSTEVGPITLTPAVDDGRLSIRISLDV